MATLAKFVYDAGAGDVTITLTRPLAADIHPIRKANIREVTGGSGVRQRNKNYTEQIFSIELQFEPEATIDLIDTMMADHVEAGGTFKFFPDKDLGTFLTVEYLGNTWKPNRSTFTRDFYEGELEVRIAIL